jgi:hypothetical protein
VHDVAGAAAALGEAEGEIVAPVSDVDLAAAGAEKGEVCRNLWLAIFNMLLHCYTPGIKYSEWKYSWK